MHVVFKILRFIIIINNFNFIDLRSVVKCASRNMIKCQKNIRPGFRQIKYGNTRLYLDTLLWCDAVICRNTCDIILLL